MSVASELLAEARRRARISQAELARRAGIPRSVLNAYERGRRQPGAEALAQLLAAAGYELRLAPKVQRVEDEYLALILSDAIGLAESLPTGPPGELGPPVFPRATA